MGGFEDFCVIAVKTWTKERIYSNNNGIKKQCYESKTSTHHAFGSCTSSY